MKLSEIVAALTAELITNGDSVVRVIRDERMEYRGDVRVEPYTFVLAHHDEQSWNPLEIRIERD